MLHQKFTGFTATKNGEQWQISLRNHRKQHEANIRFWYSEVHVTVIDQTENWSLCGYYEPLEDIVISLVFEVFKRPSQLGLAEFNDNNH